MAEVQKLGREINLQAGIERYDIIESSGGAPDGAVGRGLDVLKARLSLVQSGQHVEYTLRVLYAGQSWTLRRRFNEVAALHDILSKRLPSLPELPAKSMVRQFNAEYLEARKAGLNSYLQEISRRRDVMNCAEVQQFFGLPEHCPASFGQPHSSEPMRAAEVHDSAFGISDFTYDPVQGLLLLGASEASWTSRMDTKITNIKLPWEPAAPNLPTAQMSLWKQSPSDLRFEMLFTCRYSAKISCVCLALMRDKGLCLCGLGDGTVGCHSVKAGDNAMSGSGNTLPLLRHTASVRAIAFDETECWVITASKDNALMVYDLRRQMIASEVQTPAPTVAMRYCPGQRRLFTGLQTGKVAIWDLSSLPVRQVGTIPDAQSQGGNVEVQPISKISALDYDPVSSTLFMAAPEGCSLWAVKASSLGVWGRKVGAVPAPSNAPTAVAWASSSREIIAGFASGSVVVFDVDKAQASFAFQAHNDEVSSVQWLDAPRRLLTASKDKTLKIWDFPSLRRKPLEDQDGFTAGVPPVSMAPPTGSQPSRAPADSAQRSSTGIKSASFDPLDPLGRGKATEGPPVSAHSPPAASAPTLAATYSTASAAPAPPPLLPGSQVSPPPSLGSSQPARPSVAGAPAGAAVRDDSDDDDLAGWAR